MKQGRYIFYVIKLWQLLFCKFGVYTGKIATHGQHKRVRTKLTTVLKQQWRRKQIKSGREGLDISKKSFKAKQKRKKEMFRLCLCLTLQKSGWGGGHEEQTGLIILTNDKFNFCFAYFLYCNGLHSYKIHGKLMYVQMYYLSSIVKEKSEPCFIMKISFGLCARCVSFKKNICYFCSFILYE